MALIYVILSSMTMVLSILVKNEGPYAVRSFQRHLIYRRKIKYDLTRMMTVINDIS